MTACKIARHLIDCFTKVVAITLRKVLLVYSFSGLWNLGVQIINIESPGADLNSFTQPPVQIVQHPETSNNKKLDAADRQKEWY